MSDVAIISCTSYDEVEVLAAVERGVSLLGSAGKFVQPGEKILLKPITRANVYCTVLEQTTSTLLAFPLYGVVAVVFDASTPFSVAYCAAVLFALFASGRLFAAASAAASAAFCSCPCVTAT